MKTIKNNIEVYKALASRFTVDPETGIFTNIRTGNSRRNPHKDGGLFIETHVNGKRVRLKAHRLAWFIYYGEMPPTLVDHINEDRADNRKCNLQLLSHRDNLVKSLRKKGGTSSQWTGVTWDKQASKWRAKVTIDGKSKYLGLFHNQFLAACAYQNALTAHLSEARKNVNL